MRRILFLCSTLLIGCQMFGSNLEYTFSERADASPDFTDSLVFVLDTEARLTLDDIRRLPDDKFTSIPAKPLIEAPAVIWAKIRVANAGPERFDAYFRVFTFIDSVWMYTFQEETLRDVAFSGSVLRPWEKSLSTNKNNLPFSLYAGETKTFYFKLRINKVICDNFCLSQLRVIPRATLDFQQMLAYASEAFYAGIMLLFGIVSIFLFVIFREMVFVWFALMMFSFLAYFSVSHNLGALFFNQHYVSWNRLETAIIVSCIILSSSLFVSQYIDFPTRSRRLYRVFWGVTLVAATIYYIVLLLTGSEKSAILANDIMTVAWLLLLLGVVIYFVHKKDKPSVILLVSMSFMVASAIPYILTISRLLNINFRFDYTFQIGTVLFSGILFYGMFEKINTIRAEKQRYEELDSVKSRFFANISHEFRTPLTLVMGPIKDVLANTHAPQDRNRLQLAYQSAERLLQLINQLLDLSKLESNKMELLASEQNLAAMLKGIALSFESLAERKHIQYNFVAQNEHIPVYVDQDKVEKIFYNLLSNAFKFTPENGEIAVMITDHEDRVKILVRDNGVGISAARLPNIFNRFFQGDHATMNAQEGSGIGLALVKELVQLHQGTIEVESTASQGTTFTVTFLKGKEHLKAYEIVSSPVTSPTDSLLAPTMEETPTLAAAYPAAANLEEDWEIDDATPTVLIVEDNTAVREYIKHHLTASCKIIEAIDGQEGIDKALELLPDLIISDVMMPKKNGYDVCKTLKTDERTSHIPIILLTAKAASEEKMKGLEIGADDYLVKPFDTKELEVRTRNLIESRRLLRERFSAADTIEPQTAGTNAVDRAFLEKVCTLIESHLADEQFGVEFLAQEIGLSRSQLNRKLKALTDQSSNKFIQSFRLQKARALLLAGQGNVSEVAFQTGFNSTAYFVKCFGDKYGQTPGSLLS